MKITKRKLSRNGRGVTYKFILNEETGQEMSQGDWAKYIDVPVGTLTAWLQQYTIEQVCRGEHVKKGPLPPGPEINKFRHGRWL